MPHQQGRGALLIQGVLWRSVETRTVGRSGTAGSDSEWGSGTGGEDEPPGPRYGGDLDTTVLGQPRKGRSPEASGTRGPQKEPALFPLGKAAASRGTRRSI